MTCRKEKLNIQGNWIHLAHLRWRLLRKTAGRQDVVVAVRVPVSVAVVRPGYAPERRRRRRVSPHLACALSAAEMAADGVEARTGRPPVEADDLAAAGHHREREGCPLLGAERPVLGAVALKGQRPYYDN